MCLGAIRIYDPQSYYRNLCVCLLSHSVLQAGEEGHSSWRTLAALTQGRATMEHTE